MCFNCNFSVSDNTTAIQVSATKSQKILNIKCFGENSDQEAAGKVVTIECK